MKTRATMIFLLAGALFLFTVVPAQALQFGFDNITNNNAGDAAIGEAQLFVDVTDPDGEDDETATQALFTFLNIGSEASSICDVYFDDGSLLGIASIDNFWSGVSFSQPATPPNLPGANEADPDFETTAGFLADSDSPHLQQNGVNPGERLGILFDLQTNPDDPSVSLTLGHVFADLASGDLRIGIHVQGFDSGGSESFINNPNPVPEPATMLLLGAGLVGLAGFGRKKFFK